MTLGNKAVAGEIFLGLRVGQITLWPRNSVTFSICPAEGIKAEALELTVMPAGDENGPFCVTTQVLSEKRECDSFYQIMEGLSSTE